MDNSPVVWSMNPAWAGLGPDGRVLHVALHLLGNGGYYDLLANNVRACLTDQDVSFFLPHKWS
jgi:hypothetical protein